VHYKEIWSTIINVPPLQQVWNTEDGLTLSSPFPEFAQNGGKQYACRVRNAEYLNFWCKSSESFMHSHCFLLFLVFKVQHRRLNARPHDELQPTTCYKTADVIRQKNKLRRGLTAAAYAVVVLSSPPKPWCYKSHRTKQQTKEIRKESQGCSPAPPKTLKPEPYHRTVSPNPAPLLFMFGVTHTHGESYQFRSHGRGSVAAASAP
jgi:hypothetical protein